MTRRTSATLMMMLALASTGSAVGAQAGPPSGASRPVGVSGAPQAGGRITGLVINARTTQPVNVAAVTIRSAADSALVGGGFTRADGSFRIEGLRPGVYTVRVRVLGYAPVVQSGVSVAAAATDIGRILLTPVALSFPQSR